MAYEDLLSMEFHPDHEIPFTREEILEMLLQDSRVRENSLDGFQSFSKVLNSIYHFEFHDQLEELKHSYRFFNPDIENENNSHENLEENLSECFQTINLLLTEANYNEVSEEEIQNSLKEESIFPVSSEVNFDQLDTYKIFYQGQSKGKTKIGSRIPFMKKEVDFEFYNRIVLLFKVKELSKLTPNTKISDSLKPGKIYLKYFRNIPKLDLEMIFPDPKPKMKLIDKLQIWIPLISGVGILLKQFLYEPYIAKSAASPFEEGISMTVLGMLFALFGYAFKTYDKYKMTVMTLLSEIAQSLYFKDIGNNEAVLTALVDAAEEEEGKEAILAYYFLLCAENPLTSQELDERIENWMSEKHNVEIDFEVSDALRKLEELNILKSAEDGKYAVPNINETLKNLDQIWDNYFEYN